MTKRVLGVFVCFGLVGCGAAPKRAESARPAPAPQKEADPRPAFLNQAELKTGIGQADEPVRGCYTLVYSGKDGGSGTLTVDFTVAPNGSVSKVSIDTTLEDESLEQCVRKVYEGLSVPEARHATDASYPYRFRGIEE
jgi:hypothetical protein